MTASPASVAIELARTIPAPPDEVFDAWLNPDVPGSPWHKHDKLIVAPRVDGLWYWLTAGGTPHYGRFLELDRPKRIRLSWMSPNTLGLESMVTATFDEQGNGTLLTILHSGLPNHERAKAHERGWTVILGGLASAFPGKLHKR